MYCSVLYQIITDCRTPKAGRNTIQDSANSEHQNLAECSPHNIAPYCLLLSCTDWHLLTDSGSCFSGLDVACWPLEPKVGGFKPCRSHRIFQGEKILSTPSFGREVKPWVPCRRFTACKISPECYVEVGHLQAKFTGHFSPHIVPPLAARISRKTTSGECWKHLKITGLQLQLSLLRRRDRAKLVEKVVMSNTGIVQ